MPLRVPPGRRARGVLCLLALLCAGSLFACAPAATPVPVATQTLIPATATATPRPVTVTPAAPVLPAPPDLVATATPAPLQPLLPGDIALPEAFLRAMQTDLAAALALPAGALQLARVEPGIWLNDFLGCQWPRLLLPPFRVQRGYRVTWVAGTTAHFYHTVGTERFRRCEVTATVRDALLLAVDPVAQELVALAQRQVARTQDLPVRRVRVVSAAPYLWPDTGLGCPLPDTAYTAAQIPGYRIVVAAGEVEYLFHTDSERLFPCDPAREVLPATP